MLDVCHAGAYLHEKRGALGGVVVGAIDIDYIELLAKATPGSRVFCSVGADRNAHEGGLVENGHFTAAFIEAASLLNSRRGSYITDGDLFEALSAISKLRWKQTPESRGLIANNLPLVREQRELQGGSFVIGTDLTEAGIVVSAIVSGRTGIPMKWHVQLANRQRILEDFEVRFVPYEDIAVATAEVATSGDSIVRDPTSRMHFAMRGMAPIFWCISLEDLRGRVFETFQIPALWSLRAA